MAELRVNPSSANPLQVLVVDDHELVRRGVRQLLESSLQVTLFEAADVDQALAELNKRSFDLVLLDLALGERFALTSLPRLREAARKARIIVLTSMAEQLYAEQALRAGADGFVMKSEIGATLLAAIRTVLAGHVYLSPLQLSESMRKLAGRSSTPERPALSAREIEVLRLVADGRSTREIADQLNRSVKTIETHKQNLKTKLGAETPAQLIRQGLAWFGAPL